MQTTVRIGGKARRVEIPSAGGPAAGGAILVDGKPVEASVERDAEGGIRVRLQGRLYRFEAEPARDAAGGTLRWAGPPIAYSLGDASSEPADAQGETVIRAHMPGLLVSVAVKAGDAVKPGDLLAVLEAMKMQNEIRAGRAGRVAEVLAAGGATLEGGQAILRIE